MSRDQPSGRTRKTCLVVHFPACLLLYFRSRCSTLRPNASVKFRSLAKVLGCHCRLSIFRAGVWLCRPWFLFLGLAACDSTRLVIYSSASFDFSLPRRGLSRRPSHLSPEKPQQSEGERGGGDGEGSRIPAESPHAGWQCPWPGFR